MTELPDSYCIRLIDLPPSVPAQIREYPDGHIDIFVNARLSYDGQRDAVQHEIEHWQNDDFHNEDDIRTVEYRADHPEEPKPRAVKKRLIIRSMDGKRLESPSKVFDRYQVTRVGRTLYMPTGRNAVKVERTLQVLRPLLVDALHIYDVMQAPPVVPVAALAGQCERLGMDDVSFIGWAPLDREGNETATPVMMHFETDGISGSVYYRQDGTADGANVAFHESDGQHDIDIYVGLDRRRFVLRPEMISRTVDDRFEIIYGETRSMRGWGRDARFEMPEVQRY